MGCGRPAAGVRGGRSSIPGFVPERFREPIARAAQRWNVGAALLSAQIYAESNFNPFARSPAGAQGIAQFMPGTAVAYGLRDPFDAAAAIDAQAHLMHDLLAASARCRWRWPPTTPAPGRSRRAAAFPPTPRPRPTWRRSSGSSAAPATCAGGLEFDVRLVE